MPPTISRTSAEPTLYEILSLKPKRLEGQESAEQRKVVKQAYHKALLKHHPDKNPQDFPIPSSPPQTHRSPKTQSKSGSNKSSPVPKSQLIYTIDQIQHAYSVLSDAQQRREYDRQLLLTSSSSSHYSTPFSTEQKHSVSTRFHTGVETVDLDDLDFDERSGVYFASCRCGNERGFQFTDEQLEEYEEDLVLMVQCMDCSLWMRVLFDAAEEPEDEQQQQQHHSPNHRHHNNSETGQTIVVNPSQDVTERRGSHSVSGSGKGWNFNLSFNWGMSLSGSGSATTGNNPQART